MARSLILITGTGRSGTSTMSGMFHHLGVHVPGPFLGANGSNPRGFFESKWSVKFHNELFARAGMGLMDARPEAFELAQAAITPRDRKRLSRWLERVSDGHEQTVVKDPRTTWTQQLWHDVAAEHGLITNYLLMLRHPAEVIGSRMTYYAGDDRGQHWAYGVSNLARWINNQLVAERGTRERCRAYVDYNDLLVDWRGVAERLRDELNIDISTQTEPGQQHPVDEFIAPDLRRVRIGWEDLDVPARLREIAEATWQELQLQRRGETSAAESGARFDELDARYRSLIAEAAAISDDAFRALRSTAARSREQAVAAALAQANQEAVGHQRRIAEVGSRELLRVVAGRVVRKVRRSAR